MAELYQVPAKVLLQSMKRNIERFPADFMFHLNNQEVTNLKSQFVTSSWGGIRKPPYAFTEQGIAMLSSVLNSPRAIQVNIEIMRAFVNLRKFAYTYKELAEKLAQLEYKCDQQFKIVFETIRDVIIPQEKPKRKIGIKPE